MKYLYLHGFASGPESGKAQFFRGKLAGYGVDLQVPDLSEGDFEHLTISRQLRVMDREIAAAPAILIGSSMGGYLAALYASFHSNVEKLILLAPAFGFAHRWPDSLGADEIEKWKTTGSRRFFHYGYSRPMQVWWELMEDGLRHPAEPPFRQPALIFHGTGDDVVPASFSENFVRKFPHVRLRLLESDHQLTDQVETIWRESAGFLGIPGE